jgi:hypothetical protein
MVLKSQSEVRLWRRSSRYRSTGVKSNAKLRLRATVEESEQRPVEWSWTFPESVNL